ncbi:diguanylate cyclase [Clostridiaceae bacterium 35-E11]
MIKDLFINATILITFIFIISNLYRNEPLTKASPIRKKIFASFGGTVLGIVLMLFSIKLNDHAILDLRNFPIMILLTRVGTMPAFLCAVMIGLFRIFYFGLNTSSIGSFITLCTIVAGGSLIEKIPVKKELRWLYLNVFVLVCLSTLMLILIKPYQYTIRILWKFYIVFILTSYALYYLLAYVEKVNTVFRGLKQQASKDFLTGLNNTRSFDVIFNDLINRVSTFDEKLSLLMIDIDHFKRVNDTYGHPAGDEVLRQLGELMVKNSRSFDYVSRMGGEEFSVLLPDCSHERALEVAERIRKAVEEYDFILPNSTRINVTISIGASTIGSYCKQKKENFIGEADQGLYLAKRTGRNRVCSIIADRCKDGQCPCHQRNL